MALVQMGNAEEGIDQLQEGLASRPDNILARNNLAAVSAGLGRTDEAIAHYRKVLAVRPDYVLAVTTWPGCEPRIQTPSSAMAARLSSLARRAADLTPGEADTLGTLAAAYAEAGRFAEAVQTAHTAIERATQQNKPALAESLRAQTRFYEAGQPFHEPPAPAKPRK